MAGVTLNPNKCWFLQRSVATRESSNSDDGIKVTKARLQAVNQWLRPNTKLQSFLDLTTIYRKFMGGNARIVDPLHHLTVKEYKKNFKWETEHNVAFSSLKALLCTSHILVKNRL